MERGMGVRVVAEIPKGQAPGSACTPGARRDLEEFHETDEIIGPIIPLYRLTRASN